MASAIPPGDCAHAPVVSVIICTHRRPHLLPRAIESVLGQSFRDLELIVVDDASHDETPEVIRSFNDARVVPVENRENLGLPASRNRGLDHCRGEYVAFLDDDDEWRHDKLELQVRAMESCPPEVGAIWSHAIWVRTDGSVVSRRIPLNGHVNRRLQRLDTVMMQPLLVRRSVFDSVGPFDPRTSALEDYEFSLRLSRSYEFRTVDADLVTMHSTPDSMSTNSARHAEVIEYLLAKPDLLTNRSARCRWWIRASRHYAMLGDEDQWRRSLSEAQRAAPWSLRPLAMRLLGTVGGPLATVRVAETRNRVGRCARAMMRRLGSSTNRVDGPA
jgi:glycosyltransferase involved in cell wall biosynthesis